MPGAGKSTVGVLLAKMSGLRFVDTDLDIQVREQASLQEILEQRGYRALRAIEENVLQQIALDGAVISTGGSAVYSEPAMRRLAAAGPLVYLKVDLVTLQQRVSEDPLRGIASDPGQSYAAVFAERTPLYERSATITVDATAKTAEALAAYIVERLALRS